MKRKHDSKKPHKKRDSKKPRKKQQVKKPDVVVVWEKGDREGYGRRSSFSGFIEEAVAKPKLAIQAAILFHCRMLVHTPEKWYTGETVKYIERGWGLGMAEPPFSWFAQRNIQEEITNTVAEELVKVCGSDLKDPKIPDFVFLATLGKKRNWRRDCCICLSDNKMMGTTCDCGHFEIAIFRPCGHAVCVNPCFEKMMKHQGSKLETKKCVTKDGKVFLLPAQRDITSVKNFLCPLCRQDVNSVFRAEDTRFSGKHPKFNLSQLTEKCWYSSYWPHAFSSSPKE